MDTLWYLKSQKHYIITIFPPVILLPFYTTLFNVYYTSPKNYICMRTLPSKTVSRQMTYLYMFDYTCILCFLSHINWIPNSFTLYCMRLNSRVQIVSFSEHSCIHIVALAHLFMLGFKQIFTSTLTHVYWYRPFIMNGLYYIEKTSYHHIKKTTFTTLVLIQLITFVPLFIHIYLQVVILRCQEVRDLDDFNPYVPHTSLLPDPSHSLPTFWLNLTSFSNTPAVETAS